MQQLYPDVSDLFEAKARRRHELMALSWEEKVRIIERMQRLLPKGAWQNQSVQKSVLHVPKDKLLTAMSEITDVEPPKAQDRFQ